MPNDAEPPDVLLDTSAAVAFAVADHAHHEAVFRTLRGRRTGLAGHAAFETFSVLTRLPPPARLTPAAAGRLLATSFRHTRFLSADHTGELLTQLPERGVTGGSVYDALIGWTAKEHGVVLATRDLRALQTYRALDVAFELV